MSDTDETRQWIRELRHVEAIKTLKHAYIRHMTFRDYPALESLLTEDIETSYSDGKYVFADRQKLLTFLEDSMEQSEGNIVYWMVGMPEITVHSDETASGIWAFSHYHFMTKLGEVNELLAYYSDDYRVEDGRWKICKTGYRIVLDRMIPRDAVPYRVIGPAELEGI